MSFATLRRRALHLLGLSPLIGLTVLIATGIGLALAGVVLLGMPGPNDSLRLDSPYGPGSVELGQRCNGLYCTRHVTYRTLGAAGRPVAADCDIPLDVAQTEFFDVAAHWTVSGKAVTLQFGGTGTTHDVTINFARDCQ